MKKLCYIAMLLFIAISCSGGDESGGEELKEAPKFDFQKLVTSSTNVSESDILKQVSGDDKTGWTIKDINSISHSDIATFDSAAKKLEFKKAGKITATIVLQKSGYKDATIANCAFEKIVDAPNFNFTTLVTSSTNVSESDILKQVSGDDKTGWTIKDITTISDSSVADFKSATKEIEFKKYGIITCKIILEKSGYKDATIINCVFEKKPKSIKINKIDILKFPEFKPDRSTWDLKYLGQSPDVRRPDLVWDIRQVGSSTKLFKLSDSSRDSNAQQGKVYPHSFTNPLTIQKGISYVFYLYDYDTTSSDDAMGTVPFQVPDGYPDSKTFESSNDEIHIKVYFTYN